MKILIVEALGRKSTDRFVAARVLSFKGKKPGQWRPVELLADGFSSKEECNEQVEFLLHEGVCPWEKTPELVPGVYGVNRSFFYTSRSMETFEDILQVHSKAVAEKLEDA